MATRGLVAFAGNVGKTGLALLLSPRNTLMREPDLDTWELISHSRFDGKFEDNFRSTSLHLSLIRYEQPLNTQNHGARDKEACYLEAVISAYDKGAWVADLDLLHLVNGAVFYLGATCSHDEATKRDTSGLNGMTSIDN
ncbi:hypothetical protein OEA41_003651 [Lepraria neglecta]|uniref:Uncharacterized protein n=1 Tax=Lepraria neglecta TaxID=209136 RepID=A0AAE0DIK8_9LECA|nr:hypothetical protein OEA41_003651 [Lepraria neglecta]